MARSPNTQKTIVEYNANILCLSNRDLMKKNTMARTIYVLGKIKKLIKEGNIRRITIKNKEGKTVFEIPLTFGVVGALIAPQLAAIGAIAALVTEATVVVEKVES